MNRHYFLQLWRRNALKVAVVTAGATIWGVLAPVLYQTVITSLKSALPAAFTKFGSGNLGTLTGTITVMFEHPLLIALACTVAVAITVPAIAGQRQRGTLEMLLARPFSRISLVSTVALAVATMLMVVLAGMVLGIIIGASVEGLMDQLPAGRLVLVWLNAVLLFSAFAAFALAASASSNRNGPAIGITLGYLVINYFIEILGGYLRRPDGSPEPWQSYNLFHHFQAGTILDGNMSPFDLVVLVVLIAIPLAVALYRFPRRDLPAPG